jgi:hypothetical protein
MSIDMQNGHDTTTATAEATDMPSAFDGESIRESHSLPWPDAIALTALLVFIALMASGWFDSMLPWTGHTR